MSVEENKAIARSLVEEGWANPDILDEMIAANITVHPNDYDLETYKQGCAAFMAACPYSYVLQDIIAEGDKIAVSWEFSGTHKGEWAGAPPTNNQVSWRGMTIFEISGGKVIEQWNVWDSYAMAEQLGIIPSWEEAAKQAQSKLG
jgi:predicted ester cyclase